MRSTLAKIATVVALVTGLGVAGATTAVAAPAHPVTTAPASTSTAVPIPPAGIRPLGDWWW